MTVLAGDDVSTWLVDYPLEVRLADVTLVSFHLVLLVTTYQEAGVLLTVHTFLSRSLHSSSGNPFRIDS